MNFRIASNSRAVLGLCVVLATTVAASAQEYIDTGYHDAGYEPVVNYNATPGAACCDRFWLGGEYLLWSLDGSYLPPLVTASPDGTPLDDAGVLGEPTTQVLLGNQTVGDGTRDGYRVFGGWWLDNCCQTAIVGDYFELGRDSLNYLQGDDPNLIISRPYYNTETGAQDSEEVSVPTELDGTVAVSAYDDFSGAGIALQQCLWRCNHPCDPCRSAQFMLIGGYRHYKYDTYLRIEENLTVLPGTSSPLVVGTQIQVIDEFLTENEFHGGELGIQGKIQQSWWWIDGTAKLAIGSNKRTVTVRGQTTSVVPGVGTSVAAGGLLTSEVTNIGTYEDSSTVIIPELRIGIGGQVTDHISLRAGYNVILWDDVARASSHLPPGLKSDPRNLPPVVAGGGPSPVFPGITGSHLVAHGLDVGVTVTY